MKKKENREVSSWVSWAQSPQEQAPRLPCRNFTFLYPAVPLIVRGMIAKMTDVFHTNAFLRINGTTDQAPRGLPQLTT